MKMKKMREKYSNGDYFSLYENEKMRKKYSNKDYYFPNFDQFRNNLPRITDEPYLSNMSKTLKSSF